MGKIIGIDLGTTNSCVATALANPPEVFVPKTGEAVGGTPKFGENDPLWNEAAALTVDQKAIGNSPATAKAYLLWDEANLYVRVEVQDANIDITAAEPYMQDSVEVFVSEANVKGAYSAEEGNQYRVTAEGKTSFKTEAAGWDDSAATVTATDTGYVAEMKIPFRNGFAPKVNDVIGFDIQINDAPPATEDRPQITWSDNVAGGYSTSAKWGDVTLAAAASAMPANAQASAAATGEPVITFHEQTNDGSTLLPIRAIAEALGATVSWDGATDTVTIIKDGETISFMIGQALPDGMGVGEIKEGRAMVPTRFISETLGVDVVWDEATQTISIYN